jgi:hypothetical protein
MSENANDRPGGGNGVSHPAVGALCFNDAVTR